MYIPHPHKQEIANLMYSLAVLSFDQDYSCAYDQVNDDDRDDEFDDDDFDDGDDDDDNNNRDGDGDGDDDYHSDDDDDGDDDDDDDMIRSTPAMPTITTTRALRME